MPLRARAVAKARLKRLRSCGSFHPSAEEQRNDQTIVIEQQHLNNHVPVGICKIQFSRNKQLTLKEIHSSEFLRLLLISDQKILGHHQQGSSHSGTMPAQGFSWL